ncbi:MAG: class I SAM-dependent methyltransferase [Bacteroidia bacterium]|nr:class I SAM-dependent methyltransferase [Bacteroidia bacterium]
MLYLLENFYYRFVPRLSFQVIRRYVARMDHLFVLDVGCGNRSPSLFKRYFPNCIYIGLDRETDYNLTPEDKACMDHFILMDLNHPEWERLPNGEYDLITLIHVIEHIPNGEEVLFHLWQKLKPGGYLYIETPSERSLYLPSMPGTLNFFDDPTHIRLYTPTELANHLLRLGARIHRIRIARNYRRLLFLPVIFIFHLLFKGTIKRGVLWWDLTGFAYYILAQKPLKTPG